MMASRKFDPSVSPRPGALIIGGDHGSLGVARSLGRRGIPVWFLTDDKIIAKFSRYTKRTFYWQGPEHPQASEFLLALAAEHNLSGWVLFPAGDREVKLVAQNHAALSAAFRVFTQPWDITKIAADKSLMYARAASLGIGYPKSYSPRNREAVAQLDAAFPLILKPALKEGMNTLTQAKAWPVADRAELIEKYDEAAALVGGENIVVQELIPGGGATQLSYTGVWHDGAPVASMIARRTRQYPIEFGTGTFVESVEQQDVEDAAGIFLKAMNFNGLIEIEFKFDARDGRHKIIDVNPRVWTWNALGELSGVDFPWIQWQLATGENVAPSRGRAGASWIYVSKDMMAAGREMLAGVTSLATYVQSFHFPLGFAAFAGDDPLPALIDFPLAAWRMLRRIYAAKAVPDGGRSAGQKNVNVAKPLVIAVDRDSR
jgi:predicted ATP-grasp superfamily ATP-dependent carboligase